MYFAATAGVAVTAADAAFAVTAAATSEIAVAASPSAVAGATPAAATRAKLRVLLFEFLCYAAALPAGAERSKQWPHRVKKSAQEMLRRRG